MPSIKRIANSIKAVRNTAKTVNWHPGHMYSGMQAMIGKLNTVDCVIEVHDARIPTIGRNIGFRNHLGAVKPHLLVLNKCDLADLTDWKSIKARLADRGDKNVILTDMSGSEFSLADRGYTKIMDKAFELMRDSDRYNRAHMQHYKVMIVGIPNVGKSTLVNRLRQHHLGSGGEATRTGNEAGVTKHVETMIKICARPLIYSLDTPGVLRPSSTKVHDTAMKLALCSTINDKALDPHTLARYLLDYLNGRLNFDYTYSFNIEHPEPTLEEFCKSVAISNYPKYQVVDSNFERTNVVDSSRICWELVKKFRKGHYGKVMFE